MVVNLHTYVYQGSRFEGTLEFRGVWKFPIVLNMQVHVIVLISFIDNFIVGYINVCWNAAFYKTETVR